MALCAVMLLVLAAPDSAVDLKYKTTPGVTFRDATIKTSKLRLFSGTRIVKYHVVIERVVDRTVLDGGRERIFVAKFVKRTIESPTEKAGEKPVPGHGMTFIWKDGKLYDGEGDVTKKFTSLVESLKTPRDVRLPGKPVAVGDSWKVGAADFMRASGQKVGKGVEGETVFTLQAVENGVARIAFEGKRTQKERGRTISGSDRGVWLFDVRQGRDREFKMDGKIVVGQRGGDGTLKMTRTVTAKRD